MSNHRWLRLSLVGIGLTYLRILSYLTLHSSRHVFLKWMPSALRGYISVTGPILEVLRYVPIPAVRARIHRPHQPYVCGACLAYILDPDSLATADSGRRVTYWSCHTYTFPVINMTLPGNPESYSDCLRERLDSPPEMPPRHKGISLCSLSTNPYEITWYRHVVDERQWKLVLDRPWC